LSVKRFNFSQNISLSLIKDESGMGGKVVKAPSLKRVGFGSCREEGKLAVRKFKSDLTRVGPVLLWFRGEQDE
jgi:hypothetical protein